MNFEQMYEELYKKLNKLMPEAEIRMKAELAVQINQLKKERNAVILGHNYMEPALFHSIPDFKGDSLELARQAAETDKDIIVFCGVRFMAETAKILNPEKTVLLPAEKAGCSLAESITAEDVRLLKEKFPEYPMILMTGGSMMYVDAVCKGIDIIPTIDPELRKEIFERYERDGIDPIRRELKLLDPDFYNQVDLKNHKRVIHAVEVCLMAGKPYSSLRTNSTKKRDFKQIHIGLDMDRSELYDRINRRVDKMTEEERAAEINKVRAELSKGSSEEGKYDVVVKPFFKP